jgi:hypothetical protein
VTATRPRPAMPLGTPLRAFGEIHEAIVGEDSAVIAFR